ncbi:ABC transporter permease [Chitinophaga japonensis]|uniref:Transport permease protein n=1 Tax=Chitinophaga japonensis TaxID=104662 RepID=A0A562T6F8_CHIJA|nr:ABC transporter permease [Chitinophaga japonensis]TWI88943.1 ABC-2 type transport system permease protein [Chitinophaga japonensis]
MAVQYSQWRAMLAITKASLRSIFRSPSTVAFSIGFPLVFILVFGFIGRSSVTVKVGVAPGADTGSYIYRGLAAVNTIKLVQEPPAEMEDDMIKGRITAIVNITDRPGQGAVPAYEVSVRSSTAGVDKIHVFRSILTDVINRIDDRFYQRPSVAHLSSVVVPGRAYKTIDFILPGMLGFSLLSAAVFGTAFLFFSLRQTLVLKRFFATPVKRTHIILGETFSRLLFQLFGAIVIIGLGHFAFGFTLVHGFVTFIEMLILSLFGLVVFMGFGFLVSSVARNESTIPPIANVISMPQFLLAGTFFSVDALPSWLQPVCRMMPLTYLNDAFRKVAFEGLHLWNVGLELGVLTLWGVIIYAVTIRVFKWE